MASVLSELFGTVKSAFVDNQQTQQAPAQQQSTQPPAEEPKSFDDKFKDISEPVDPKTLPEKFDPSKLFDTDPNKLRESVNNLDFTRNVSQEDMQGVLEGGDKAVGALKNILNNVARDLFYNSTVASTQLVQAGVAKSLPAVNSQIQTELRRSEIDRTLKGTDPIFNSKAARIMLDPLKNQILQKMPDAAPEEVARIAKEILTDFAKQITPETANNNSGPNAGKKDTDWDQWLNS